jgi:hypothetical protein
MIMSKLDTARHAILVGTAKDAGAAAGTVSLLDVFATIPQIISRSTRSR